MYEDRPFFDLSLRYRVAANNRNPGIVMNRQFADLEGVVYSCHESDADDLAVEICGNENQRLIANISSFLAKPYSGLLKRCREHRDNYSRIDMDNTPENLIVLTHPFYLFMNEMDAVDTEKLQEEADIYWEKMEELFTAPLDKERVAIIALETPQSYAAVTSLYLENGLIDDVVFTYFDEGDILYDEDKGHFYGRNIFLAGGYNGKCLAGSHEALMSVTDENKIRPIIDLVMSSLDDSDTLLNPWNFETSYGPMPFDMEVYLDDVISDLRKKEFEKAA